MATIPVVDTVDKRIGIISALALLLITFVVLLLLTYDIPNPLPKVRIVPAVVEIDEIVLKKLVIEGGAGGGTPSDAENPDPKPQTQQSITQTSKPSQTSTVTGGQSNTSTTTNSQNDPSGGPSANPFGGGGSGGGSGGGNGTGVGTTDGSNGTGTAGIGFGSGRTRINNVSVHDISIETSAKIFYKLTVDSNGNVVAFSHYASKTTTTDQTLINRIGFEIKKQVKYSKSNNAPLVYQDYTISVTSN